MAALSRCERRAIRHYRYPLLARAFGGLGLWLTHKNGEKKVVDIGWESARVRCCVCVCV